MNIRTSCASKFVMILLVVFCGLSTQAKKHKNKHENKRQSASESASATTPSDSSSGGSTFTGPLDDCLRSGRIYERLSDLQSVCTLNYVHYFPREQQPLQSNIGQIKIGSYNMFHLGDDVAPLKNMRLMASIIDHWDVVGAQELMPLPKDWMLANRQIDELLVDKDGNLKTFPYDNWVVNKPGYLQLLDALRERDKSWSLIMQATAEGEGNTGEMAGFYYRSSRVRLKELSYCRNDLAADVRSNTQIQNLGCGILVNPADRALMSRLPFTAYFQAQNFDFIAISAHLRFHPAQDAEDLKQQKNAVCANTLSAKCKLPKDLIGRFFETLMTAKEIANLQKIDKDVIFMGDFNTEIKRNTMAFWKASLKPADGFNVYQQEKSSLSLATEGLASNYDHFVYNEKITKQCQSKSIRTFNYLLPNKKLSDESDASAAIANFQQSEQQTKFLSEKKAFVDLLIKPNKSKNPTSARMLNEKEKSDIVSKYEKALDRLNQNKIGPAFEMLSDHLPIEMTCNLSATLD